MPEGSSQHTEASVWELPLVRGSPSRGPKRQGSSQNLVLAVFTEEHVHFKKYQSGKKKYQSDLSSLVVQRNSKDAGGVESRAFEQKGTAVVAEAQEGSFLMEGVCHSRSVGGMLRDNPVQPLTVGATPYPLEDAGSPQHWRMEPEGTSLRAGAACTSQRASR